MSSVLNVPRETRLNGLTIRLLLGLQSRLAADAFPAILGFRLCNGLPLHVGWMIEATTGERDDVVDDVARAGAALLSCRGAGCSALELGACRSIPLRGISLER